MTSSFRVDGDALVVLRGVSKTYGQFQALDDVSFAIRAGEVFGYIGPNGAGKTTTMKILIGLITDFQGDVAIGGCRIPQQIGEAHKLLGYLPQNVAFQEWRTVDQALLTFGRLSGLTDTQLEGRIPALLDLLSLSDVRHKKISQLSGGMAQKVGLAQALLHEPKLLVLDEPLGGLDPLSRHQLKEIVLNACQEWHHDPVFFAHTERCRRALAAKLGARYVLEGSIREGGSALRVSAQLVDAQTGAQLWSETFNRDLQACERVRGPGRHRGAHRRDGRR